MGNNIESASATTTPSLNSTRLKWLETEFDAHSSQLTRYAYRLTGNIESAREAVQDTFLKLCKQKQDDFSGTVVRWLFTVCRNHIFDVMKKEKRMVGGVLEERVPDLNNRSASELVETKQSTGIITDLLEKLPSNQQEIIRLRFQNDLSYKEISEITGLTVSHVGVLLHNGLKVLRNEYNKKTDSAGSNKGGEL